MKRTFRTLLLSAFMASALATIHSAYAADSSAKGPEKAPGQAKENPASENSKAKRDWYPFSGIVASVDQQAKTIALKKKEGERVIRMDAKSKLEINGKSQTIYPWDSWTKTYSAPPPVWFHDVLQPDGTPFRQQEVDFIRRITGAK